MKKCRRCGIEKSYSNFHKWSANKDGYKNYCKECKRVIDFKKKNPTGDPLIKTSYKRQCRLCLKVYPTSKFRIRNNKKHDPQCFDCRSSTDHLKNVKKKGISADVFLRMLKDQDGLCKICKRPQESKNGKIRRLSIDHDHNCCSGKLACGRCVRGLLCSSCNHALGFVRDDIEVLKKMIDYLNKY